MWFEDTLKQNKPILALAPMADYTNAPFCAICREVAGKDFVIFREMVSAEAIVRGNEKTLKMCEFDPVEHPVVHQIFGAKPETMLGAAKIIVDRFKTYGIDVNMGCPVPKITGKVASGATLMKNQDVAVEIVKSLKKANLGVPISVKTRLGWTKDTDILKFAPKLESAGADLISIHGRTKKQGYSGKANWERIGETKKLLSVPLIANGDIQTSDDIARCLKSTRADGVMIGRGALGNPWIFKMPNEKCQMAKKIEIVLKHAKLHLEHYGEEYGLVTFRKHLVWYFRGVKGIKRFKSGMVKVTTLNELEGLLLEIGSLG